MCSELLVAKIGALLGICLISMIIGCAPFVLSKIRKKFRPIHVSSQNAITSTANYDKYTSLLLCFGGGVLFFTTFMHLQPEVRATFHHLEHSGHMESIDDTYGFQLSEIIICCGFFLVYIIEECMHLVLSKTNLLRQNERVEMALSRSLSLRRFERRHSNSGIVVVAATASSDEPTNEPNYEIAPKLSSIFAGLSKLPKQEATATPTSCHELSIFDRIEDDHPQPGHSQASLLERSTVSLNQSSELKSDTTLASQKQHANMKSVMRGFITVMALSIHAIFEGLAVGLEESVVNVWYMLLAIATHKFVIIFCIGIELHVAKMRPICIVLYILSFSIVTPVGIGIGIVLVEFGSEEEPEGSDNNGVMLTGAVLQALAAGTLLYVIFFEVLVRNRVFGGVGEEPHFHHHHHNQQSEQAEHHHHHHHANDDDTNGLLQLFAIICGFLFMFIMHVLTKSEYINLILICFLFVFSLSKAKQDKQSKVMKI